MSLINENLQKIVPNKSKEYNISFNEQLGEVGAKIFNWLEENNKLEESHKFNGISYRWAFGNYGGEVINYILNNIPKDLSTEFREKIIKYLGIDSLYMNEIKFEKLGANKFVDDIHLKRSRFGEIIPTKEDNLPKDYNIFYSQ